MVWVETPAMCKQLHTVSLPGCEGGPVALKLRLARLGIVREHAGAARPCDLRQSRRTGVTLAGSEGKTFPLEEERFLCFCQAMQADAARFQSAACLNRCCS